MYAPVGLTRRRFAAPGRTLLRRTYDQHGGGDYAYGTLCWLRTLSQVAGRSREPSPSLTFRRLTLCAVVFVLMGQSCTRGCVPSTVTGIFLVTQTTFPPCSQVRGLQAGQKLLRCSRSRMDSGGSDQRAYARPGRLTPGARIPKPWVQRYVRPGSNHQG